MSVVPHNEQEVKLLARLMRAEAEGDGDLGMLLVGNVGVNRAKVNCSDFKNIRTITQMVYQSPGGFEATQKGYFYQPAREKDIRLARRVLKGETFSPAERALWFFNPYSDECPPTFFGQWNTGRYKTHVLYLKRQKQFVCFCLMYNLTLI